MDKDFSNFVPDFNSCGVCINAKRVSYYNRHCCFHIRYAICDGTFAAASDAQDATGGYSSPLSRRCFSFDSLELAIAKEAEKILKFFAHCNQTKDVILATKEARLYLHKQPVQLELF